MKKIALIAIVCAVVSCKSTQPIQQIPVRTVERKVTTLVPFYIPGDSTALTALFECDSLNRVLLKSYNDLKGTKVHSAVNFSNGKLNYQANFKPDTIYLPSDTIYTEKEVPIITEVPKIEYRQTRWQKFRCRVGDITIAILLLIGGWQLIKLKFKLF